MEGIHFVQGIDSSKSFPKSNSRRENWLRGLDLNQRPSGYEPDELPGCSTPRDKNSWDINSLQIEKRPSCTKGVCLSAHRDFVE
jgi:hypothetical protein